MPLTIKPKHGNDWDLVSLGEVMLRFDPGDYRVATARTFTVSEGGGEYNVARGLKRCFGLETAIVTVVADNAVGRLLQDLLYQGGVDQSLVRWVEYDGVGRKARNGLNFTERGFGIRAAQGCSDRGHTAISQLKAGEINWEEIFGRRGARWFHTGGIFCALSETTPEVALEAIQCARKHGTIAALPSAWLTACLPASSQSYSPKASEVNAIGVRLCRPRARSSRRRRQSPRAPAATASPPVAGDCL